MAFDFKKSFLMLLLLLSIAFSLASCGGSGYTHITGQYVSVFPDYNYIVSSSEDGSTQIIRLYIASNTEIDFSDLTTGDIIDIKIVLIQRDDTVCFTEVFDYSKEADGAAKDINSDILNKIYQLIPAPNAVEIE